MSRPRVHIHSDCDFFAGCENMPAVLLGDARLRERFDLSFSFRDSPAYREGFHARVAAPPPSQGLPLLDWHQLSRAADGWPFPVPFTWKLLCRLLLMRWWLTLYDAFALWRHLRGRRIRLLHINAGGWPSALSDRAAAIAARAAGIPRVVHVVNNLARGYDGPDRWSDWPFDRFCARRTDLFVTGSRAAADRLAAVLRLPPGKTEAVPNGVRRREPREPAAAVRARFGVTSGRALCAVVAVLERRKGHRVLLEALARLPDGERPFLVIEGEGSLRAELEAAVASLRLSADVRLAGWEPDVFSLLAAADMVALPSIEGEDFPNVTLEAMGMGKAVVATRVAGIPEQIDDGANGLLVPPGDPEALAAALRRLSDPALRARLGSAARQRYDSLYTPEAAARRWEALYDRLLALP